jgi:xylose dehydrogenase (NAD/NADP)
MTTRDLKKEPLRVGIIGCGSFIQRRILPSAHEIDTVKIVCLQTRDEKKAKQLQEQLAIQTVTKKEELLSHPFVEAVLIASPNHMHEEDALLAAAYQKPTLCEKPLALSSKSILRMLEAFEEKHVPFFVGHSLRFKPAIQKAKELLETGSLGALRHIEAQFSIPVKQENWRHSTDQGGGVLYDIGIHLIDCIRYVTGQEFRSVKAYAKKKEGFAPHTIHVLGTLSDGALATFSCSFEEPYYSAFAVVGERSRLISTYSLRQSYDPQERLMQIQEDDAHLYFPLKASNIYVDELKHFAASVIQKKSPLIEARIALANQRVIEEIERNL